MKEIVFVNGRFVERKEAVISVCGPGLQYGWGVFETMRSLAGHIVCLKEHIKRLQDGARRISIPLSSSSASLKEIVIETVARNCHKDSYVRLSVYKEEQGCSLIVSVRKLAPWPNRRYKKGFRCCISEFLQNENSFFSGIKATNRLMYELAYQRSLAKDFDEALILNRRKEFCEGSRTNLFLVSRRVLITPSLSSGCLEGITRNAVIALAKKNRIAVKEKPVLLEELLGSDEAFLTNSLRGIMPLVSLERRRIATGKPGRSTLLLMREYRELVCGRNQ